MDTFPGQDVFGKPYFQFRNLKSEATRTVLGNEKPSAFLSKSLELSLGGSGHEPSAKISRTEIDKTFSEMGQQLAKEFNFRQSIGRNSHEKPTIEKDPIVDGINRGGAFGFNMISDQSQQDIQGISSTVVTGVESKEEQYRKMIMMKTKGAVQTHTHFPEKTPGSVEMQTYEEVVIDDDLAENSFSGDVSDSSLAQVALQAGIEQKQYFDKMAKILAQTEEFELRQLKKMDDLIEQAKQMEQKYLNQKENLKRKLVYLTEALSGGLN